ncbi:MAG: diacylglycerol kinase family protein [Pseudomonadota bacterium]
MYFRIFFNSKSGSQELDKLKELFAKSSWLNTATITWTPIKDLHKNTLPTLLGQTKQPDALLTAGGDGTSNLFIQHVIENNITLPVGVLPLGTFNYFARYINNNKKIEETVEHLELLSAQPYKILMANNNVVLNNISLGLYKNIIDTRERFKKITGRYRFIDILASLWVIIFTRHSQIHLSIASDEHFYFNGRASVIFICANPLQWQELDLPQARILDTNEIGIIIVPALRLVTLLKMLWGKLIRKVIDKNDYQVVIAKSFNINVHSFRYKKQFKAVIDGEVVNLSKTLILKYSQNAVIFLK